MGVPAYTQIVHRRGSDLWRVRVGRFMTMDEARRALDILALNSIENGGISQDKPAATNK
ncbi:MAG: SPOR domain-containing protein [Sutterellaceae bacterium]|nr:SPOR domain-containing protein [Sutterellaceae bacterium]